MYIQVSPIVDYTVRKLCCRPYPRHDRGKRIGCPNYNLKEGCPPAAPFFDKVFDLTRPVFAIYNVFDLEKHVKKMKAAHPNWSDAQLKSCLLWQNGARKQLSKNIVIFLMEHPEYTVAVAGYRGIEKDLGDLYPKVLPASPEAMGVDVTKTMASVGIYLEWPPDKVTYQVALAGVKHT